MGIRVPTLDTPQVGSVPLPVVIDNTRIQPDPWGMAIGGALEQVGGVLAQVEKREQAKAHAAVLNGAQAELGRQSSALLVAPDTGALNRKGQAAVGLTDSVMAEFDKAAGRLRDGLPTEEARADFERMVAAERDQVYVRAARHEADQSAALDEGNYRAAVGEAADAAASAAVQAAKSPAVDEVAQAASLLAGLGGGAAPGAAAGEVPRAQLVADDLVLEGARQKLLDALARRAQAHGWSPAMVADERKNRLTEFHASVLIGLLSADHTAEARAYLERARPEMAPGAVAKLEERIRPRLVAGQALEKALQLERQFPDQKARAAAALDIPDAGMQEAVVKALEARQDVRDRAQTRFDRDGTGRIFVQLERTGGYYDFRGDVEFASLSPAAQAAVEARANAERRQRIAATKEDRAAQAAADREARAEFANLDLAEKARVEVDQVYAGASKAVRLQLQGMKGKAAKLLEQGKPVGYGEFQARVKQAAQILPAAADREQLLGIMDGWWFQQRDAHPDEEPPAKLVGDELARQLLMRDPGTLRSNQPTFKLGARAKDVEVAPEGKQLYPPSAELAKRGAAAAAPAAPGPAKTVVGRSRQADGRVVVKYSDGTYGEEAR